LVGGFKKDFRERVDVIVYASTWELRRAVVVCLSAFIDRSGGKEQAIIT
jgi:hypothetical protein